MLGMSSSCALRVGAGLAFLVGSGGVATAEHYSIPPFDQPSTVLTRPQPSPQIGSSGPAQKQEKIYQGLLHLAATPLVVGGRSFDVTVDMNESRPPSGKEGPGVVSGVFAEPPDTVGKLTFLIFQRPRDADTFMAVATDPSLDDQGTHSLTLRAQLPDGVMQSFSVADTKSRFPGRLYCYFVRPTGQQSVSALCAYHPPGTSLVSIVFIPEEIKSPVAANYTGSVDTKNITVNFAGAAAAKLVHFVATSGATSGSDDVK